MVARHREAQILPSLPALSKVRVPRVDHFPGLDLAIYRETTAFRRSVAATRRERMLGSNAECPASATIV
jgi:hypothetical protein